MGKAPIDPIPESAERSDSPEGSTPEKFLAPRGYPALPSLVPPPSSQPHTHKTGSAGLTRAQSEAALVCVCVCMRAFGVPLVWYVCVRASSRASVPA